MCPTRFFMCPCSFVCFTNMRSVYPTSLRFPTAFRPPPYWSTPPLQNSIQQCGRFPILIPSRWRTSLARGDYKYRPLPSRVIRIANLEPAERFNDPLHISLEHVQVDDPTRPQYEALSYVWGSARGDREVLCDGRAICVTPNCEAALRHLRQRTKPRALWIDAVCIDQSSNPEKSHQVPMMGDIYESAHRVIVWLGTGSADVAALFRRATRFDPIIRLHLYALMRFGPVVGEAFRNWNVLYAVVNWAWHTFSSTSHSDAMLLRDIGASEWFTRMWTLQEHLLAKHSLVVAGYHSCAWTTFANYWIWSTKSIQALEKSTAPAALRLVTWIAFKNAVAPRGVKSLSATKFDIFSGFVECARTHGVSDPRDKIYAFVPLIRKIDPHAPALAVDYDASCAEVYEEFARYAIRLFGTLEYLEKFPPLLRESALPSWVMDLQVPAKYPMRRWAASQLKAQATRDSKVDLELLAQSERGELWLRGQSLSSIKIVSEMVPLEVEDANEVNSWFNGWLKEVGERVLGGQEHWAYPSLELGIYEFIEGVARFNPFLAGSILFFTSSGHVGISQFDVKVGDEVALLDGCALPTILRGVEGQKHRFLGASYVAGVSHGEVWESDNDNEERWGRETFVLV